MNDLASSAASDGEGFDEFFRRDFVPLVAFVRKTGTPPAVAEDAAAEAMTTLYRQWNSVDAPAAWVRTTAARLAAKIQMREREAVARSLQSTHEPMRSAPSAEDVVTGRDAVIQLLSRLPPAQRQVMLLRGYGFRPFEIAEALGMKEPTVRSQLRHARDQLRAMLEQDA